MRIEPYRRVEDVENAMREQKTWTVYAEATIADQVRRPFGWLFARPIGRRDGLELVAFVYAPAQAAVLAQLDRMRPVDDEIAEGLVT